MTVFSLYIRLQSHKEIGSHGAIVRLCNLAAFLGELAMQTQTTNERPVHLERRIREGKTIQELASELTRIQKSKHDYTVPVSAMKIDDNGKLTFTNGKTSQFGFNNWSTGQVSSFTDVPQAYAKRLREESPALFAKNINHGLERMAKNEDTKSRLIRTIDGNVRGFLSHKYRMLDAHDLMEAVLPMLVQQQFEVVSCELTEQRLYLKTATQRIQGEVKKGDIVSYGVMVSTSDVGAGSLRVEPFFLRLWCLNGAVSESKFRQTHLGRSQAQNDVQELLTDSTKRLNDKAFFATVKDYMSHTMKPEIFQKELDKMKLAADRPIRNLNLEQVVEVTMSKVGVTGENVKKGILEALADGNQNAGLTQWGLMNSFTAAAKMPSIDYDTATDLERAGGSILNLNATEWRRIADVIH